MSDPDGRVIVVERRDWLARVGMEHLGAVLGAQGRWIVVADRGEATGDLVRGVIEVLSSMWDGLSGRGGPRSPAMRAWTIARREPGGAR